MLSEELLLLRAPFRGYLRLGEAPPSPWLGVLRLQLVLAVFVSLTTAGRLVPFHVASIVVTWGFVPAWQALAVLAGHAVARSPRSRRDALGLYFAGHAPWQLLLLLVAGVCVLVSDPAAVGAFALRRGILPALVLSTAFAGILLTHASYRAGHALPRGRAIAATLTFYLVYVGGIVGWYLAQGQLQPLLGYR
ncbi:MAG: hypothetical protein IPJ34_18910 [Myxococcales bacterium]|nr:hypothetical protein [Myxococcales bacterium]